MQNKPNISIIIPVLNELANVDKLYDQISFALTDAEFDFEVIFVDDGSTDGTREKLSKLQAKHKNLKLVAHQKNYGQSAALVSGVKQAKYPWIITLDGDLQNDPEDIIKLYNAQLQAQGRVIVVGNRKKRQDNFIRRVSSLIGNKVRDFILRDKCADTGCSLKLLPRDAFLNLPHFDHLHRYIPALFQRAGFDVINIPVNHRERIAGISKYGVMNRLFVGISDLFGVAWLKRRPCNPELHQD